MGSDSAAKSFDRKDLPFIQPLRILTGVEGQRATASLMNLGGFV
jgi:hypothetical protein